MARYFVAEYRTEELPAVVGKQRIPVERREVGQKTEHLEHTTPYVGSVCARSESLNGSPYGFVDKNQLDSVGTCLRLKGGL